MRLRGAHPVERANANGLLGEHRKYRRANAVASGWCQPWRGKSEADIVSPTITYTKAASPVKTWPWKVKTITVVCDVLPSRGVHTSPIDGVQYALFGGYAVIIEYLRYARGSQLQHDPDDRDATDSFNSIVKADCEIYARVWDEGVD